MAAVWQRCSPTNSPSPRLEEEKTPGNEVDQNLSGDDFANS